MALTLSGTNGVVGAGFTLDPSGASVTAGVGTFGSVVSSGQVSGTIGAFSGTSTFANSINLTHASAGSNYIYFNEDLQLAKNGTGARFTIDTSGNATVNSGNLVIGTSGKGIDFSATSDGGTGTPSELLDDYEEGTFTPGLSHGLTPDSSDGFYIKIGQQVVAYLSVTYPSTADGNHTSITNLPFTVYATGRPGAGLIRYSNDDEAFKIGWHVNADTTTMSAYYLTGGGTTANVYFSTRRFDIVVTYRAAA